MTPVVTVTFNTNPHKKNFKLETMIIISFWSENRPRVLLKLKKRHTQKVNRRYSIISEKCKLWNNGVSIKFHSKLSKNLVLFLTRSALWPRSSIWGTKITPGQSCMSRIHQTHWCTLSVEIIIESTVSSLSVLWRITTQESWVTACELALLFCSFCVAVLSWCHC